MNGCKVTFIIPVGREKFLEKAVRSIQAQTINEWELLLFNNINLEIEPEDKRIKVTKTPDWPPPRCYNEGIKHADSDYILIATDDDIFFRERAMVTYDYLKNGADYFAGSCLTVDEKERFKTYIPVSYEYQWQRRVANMISLPFVGFNRNKVPRFREDFEVCYDYLFNLECGMKKINIQTTKCPLGLKREWDNSLYHSASKEKVREELERIRELFNDKDIRSYTLV